MKYIIALLLTITVILFACNTRNNSSLLSKPGDLVADEYTIQTDRDTTVFTKNGALIRIPKGSMTSSKGNSVTLEVKEAYTIDQIVLAGLTTTSNGKPLSSGGMIYINPSEGQDLSINQPLSVAVPSNYYEKGMQLYKGEANPDGTINWANPTTLLKSRTVEIIDTGKTLFQNNCGSCHIVGKDFTGPDLAHFLKRFKGDKLLVRGYTLHYPDVFAPFYFEGDMPVRAMDTIYYNELVRRLDHIDKEMWENQYLYYCNIRNWNPAIGGLIYMNFTFDELTSIYKYIQNVSDRDNLPMPGTAYLDKCIDSCMEYLKAVGNLESEKSSVNNNRNKLIKENDRLVTVIPDPTWQQTNDLSIFTDIDKKVIPPTYQGVYYQFTVNTFGWHNIDMLLENATGVEESELFVKIDGDYKEKVSTFLIIPSHKTYGQGGPADRNPEEFAFFYKTGKLPLPQNVKAYILAVTESESEASVAFALQPFTTSLKQELTISLKKSTKEEFRKAINMLNLEDFNVNVDDSKNAQQIRKADTVLKSIQKKLDSVQHLKPKNCNCSCGSESENSDSEIAIDYLR